MTRGRGGFTLVEMLMVVTLLVPLWSIAIGLATASARAAARAGAVAGAESAVGQATTILAAELGDVTPGEGVLLLEVDRIRIQAARGVGRWCLADTLGVVIASAEWAASRVPVVGRDSVVVERVATDSSGWREVLRLGLADAPISQECSPGVPGLRLPAALAPAFLPGLQPGPLVRTSEVIELVAYVSAGDTWFGIRHLGLGTPVEPVTGPFAPGGVQFAGLNAAGGVTADPAQVRAVRVRFVTAGQPSVEREVVVAIGG
jgi:prepilin-type N-terminal cleavage/methylation domain-containing protein